MDTKSKNGGKRKGRLMVWVIVIAALAVAGIVHRVGAGRLGDKEQVGLTAPVRRGPLTINLVESGTIRNRERVIVRSEVEGAQTIIHIVDEGEVVKAGDLLVELDSSSLVERHEDQAERVFSSDAAVIQASENLEVTRNQAEADISQAELNLRFARLGFEQYEKGDYPQELQQAEAAITIANEELRRAQDKLEWSVTLETEGYIQRSELDADELALKRRQLDLELAEGKLKVLTTYTNRQTKEKLESDIQQAEMALERVKRRARADIIRAETDLRSKEAALRSQQKRLDILAEQIEKCRILAPADGMVIYATSVQVQRWRRLDPPEPGQVVRERQELIHLPSTGDMMVEISVQEANLPKIRRGLKAGITVESNPGHVYTGRLKKIGVLPDSNSAALNPDLKLYMCDVYIDEAGESLRQGMSCTVELMIEHYDDALYIPLQCLLRANGSPTVYVETSKGMEARKVKVGLDNGRMVHVLEGLREGENVLLAPPLSQAERKEGESVHADDGGRGGAISAESRGDGGAGVGAGEEREPGGEASGKRQGRPGGGGGGNRGGRSGRPAPQTQEGA